MVNSFDFCLDDERWGLVEKHVQSVLQQGLSDRAKLVRVIWRSAPSNWNIDEVQYVCYLSRFKVSQVLNLSDEDALSMQGYETFGEEPMLVGLLLSSEEKCFRVVDIGPHAENKEEVIFFTFSVFTFKNHYLQLTFLL